MTPVEALALAFLACGVSRVDVYSRLGPPIDCIYEERLETCTWSLSREDSVLVTFAGSAVYSALTVSGTTLVQGCPGKTPRPIRGQSE